MTPAASVFMSAREAGKPRRWPLRMLVTVAQSDSSQAGHPSIPEPPSSPVRARLPFSCRLGRGGGRRGKPGRPRCPGRRFKHPAQQPPPFVSLVSPPFCPRGGGVAFWEKTEQGASAFSGEQEAMGRFAFIHPARPGACLRLAQLAGTLRAVPTLARATPPQGWFEGMPSVVLLLPAPHWMEQSSIF